MSASAKTGWWHTDMARDLFHAIVREALEFDGWQITHDPYPIRAMGRDYEVDLGAEQLFAAERGTQKIAVEVKSFVSPSLAYEFHAVLGQYLNYHTFMAIQEPDRVLFLAVSSTVYNAFFREAATQLILDKFSLNLVIFDIESKTIEQWIIR